MNVCVCKYVFIYLCMISMQKNLVQTKCLVPLKILFYFLKKVCIAFQ